MPSERTGPPAVTSTGPRTDVQRDALAERRQQSQMYRDELRVLKRLEMRLRAAEQHSLAYEAKDLHDYVHREARDLWGPFPELRDGEWTEASGPAVTGPEPSEETPAGYRRVVALTAGEPADRLRCRWHRCRWASDPFPPGGAVPEVVMRAARAHQAEHR